MLFLEKFIFPNSENEFDFILKEKKTCYDSFYPFQVLSKHKITKLTFEPITIFYGGNGSGKTTALNVIAEKLGIERDSVFNSSNFFRDYVKMCKRVLGKEIPMHSRIITSDDVFDYMLNVRNLNEKIDTEREGIFEEFLEAKYANFQMKSLDDYEKLQKVNKARKNTMSGFVREEIMDNVRTYSNGENAYRYFISKMGEDGLYLLDEPENSLSPERQVELLQYIEDAARFYGCQFLISTHSPFILSLQGAKIYDFDADPVEVKKWAELKNVQVYYEFFIKHKHEFL